MKLDPNQSAAGFIQPMNGTGPNQMHSRSPL